MADISVDKFTEADLDVFLEMTLLEYGPSDTSNPEHIKWKHLNSPFGASTYISLTEAGKIIGRVLVQPRPLLTAARVFNVASVMDLLISREHRSTPANFINLTKASANVSSYDLVFHTSNERTFPLYSKLFRFSNPFSLHAYGFPVRFAGLFSTIIGRKFEAIDWFTAPLRWLLVGFALLFNAVARLEISQRKMSDEELGTLCSKCLHQSGPHLARTNSFLKWRFSDAPLWPAKVFRIDRKGKLIAYAVTRKVELGELNHLVLMDFIVDTEIPFIAQLALRTWLIREAITSKSDALFTMVNSNSSIARKCVGFPLINIPDKLLPHATPIFVRARSNEFIEFETDRSVHMTLADLDYF